MSISPVVQRAYDFAGQIAIAANVATKDEVADLQGVFGYADREGFLGSIATLLHRVWNAVKALFGQSDWQRAERAFISIGGKVADLLDLDEEEAALLKAKIGKGADAEKAKSLIDGINRVNSSAKRVEALALPLLDVLIPNIDLERLVPDLVNGTITNVLNGLEKKPSSQRMPALLQIVAEKGYVKPEGLEIVGRLPELLDNLAAQTEQEPQFPGEGEL